MRSLSAVLLVSALALVVACLPSVSAGAGLYTPKDHVVELTAANFQDQVVKSNDFWIVEFYAPWCGHCKSLAPEWVKAANALAGVVRVGAVNMDEHQSVGGPYDIKGFPSVEVGAQMERNSERFQFLKSEFAPPWPTAHTQLRCSSAFLLHQHD